MDSCKDVSTLISQGMDRKLSWTERVRVRVHLAMCRNCTLFEKQLAIIRQASRAYLSRVLEQL